jgi:hypothetical protein
MGRFLYRGLISCQRYILSLHHWAYGIAGRKSMLTSAIGCACLLAVFEGVGIGMQRLFAPPVVVFALFVVY